MKSELAKAYNPGASEDEIYKKWEDSGFFNPDNLPLPPEAPSYTIVLPPPNITDRLHMGHAAMLAIEDLLIRYHRLLGFRTLWLPGTDHAAIATQNVVEKKLLKEKGQTRQDLGREKFLEEVWKFLKVTQSEILIQIRKMGASLDWSRLAFTLDEPRQQAVRRMFRQMYDEGVIYRGERIVNWCPRCHSTIADDEVEYREETTKLYWLKYGPFVLATTRPETKLGDSAIAVHPDDERYKKLVGQELEIMGVLGKFKVKVVADKVVDMNFGSGAIKVTPAHSFVDNDIAARHNLAGKKIIDEDGKMMANCGKYAGLTTAAARAAIIKDLDALGLIDHIDDDYRHNTAVCYRCGTVIEPLPSRQWFIAVDKKLARLGGESLQEKALAVAAKGEIEFVPERFRKRYHDWMTDLHDWCISRQIWFGHQIPVWYKGEEVYVGQEAPATSGWTQDPDTLDTWFSSGMWTFSTLGWPDNLSAGKKIGDLARFHPTQVLETGYEILTLWVSRMIMMSIFALNEIPFQRVYLHGMILDKGGKKMSKSRGNGVDPLDMVKKFGADAARLSIVMGATPGGDSRFSEDKVEMKRNFINKLWNISRFILQLAGEKAARGGNKKGAGADDLLPSARTAADTWILAAMAALINNTSLRLDKLEFSLAAEDLYDFTWDKLADWYLEIAKVEKGKEEILLYLLRRLLILWHPFIPYVTETIWANFNDSLLMVAKWPAVSSSGAAVVSRDKSADGRRNAAEKIRLLQEIVVAIRNARSANKIPPAKKLPALIHGHGLTPLLRGQEELIRNLRTGLSAVEIQPEGTAPARAIMIPVGAAEIYLSGAVDTYQEQARLLKERADLEKLIANQIQKLGNADFISRAPAVIVAAEKDKLAGYKTELAKIVAALAEANQ
jgi:valyl-tRNA synthetase